MISLSHTDLEREKALMGSKNPHVHKIGAETNHKLHINFLNQK